MSAPTVGPDELRRRARPLASSRTSGTGSRSLPDSRPGALLSRQGLTDRNFFKHIDQPPRFVGRQILKRSDLSADSFRGPCQASSACVALFVKWNATVPWSREGLQCGKLAPTRKTLCLSADLTPPSCDRIYEAPVIAAALISFSEEFARRHTSCTRGPSRRCPWW